jgi:hypothetical protein
VFGVAILNEWSAVLSLDPCATVFEERLEVEGVDLLTKSDKEGEEEGCGRRANRSHPSI